MTQPLNRADGVDARLVILAPTGPTAAHHLGKLALLLKEQGQAAEYWCWNRGESSDRPHHFASVRVLSGFQALGRIALVVGYLWWIWKAFWAVARSRPRDAFICERLESALPAVLASMIRPRRLLYFNSDNAALSYRWPRLVRWCIGWIEAFSAHRCVLHVVPAASRWPTDDPNLRLAQNWPSRQVAEEAATLASLRNYHRGGPLRVYVNGWLPETRGLRMIAAAAERLINAPVQFVVCGFHLEESARKLVSLPNVEHLPKVPPCESLATYYRCHLTFAFYDPAIEINRLAEPNKWFDCIVTKTPFVTNLEVQTAEPFLKSGACFGVAYDDDRALEQLLRDVIAQPEQLKSAQQALGRIPVEYWDDQMSAILQEFLQPQSSPAISRASAKAA